MAVFDQVITKKYSAYNGDAIEIVRNLPDASIHFSVFSPPFADLYAYSDSIEDMGNCTDYGSFFVNFGFLVDELRRVMMPGRIVAVHCMDLPLHKNKGEEIGVRDFSGDLVECFEEKGFVFHCPRVTIWKDPLVSATRTHALGLAHKQIVKDSTMCRVGISDYILAFRNLGDNHEPVTHPMGLTEYAGTTPIPASLSRYVGHEEQRTNKRSQWIWQKYASPVWMDIDQTDVLPYRKGKDKDDQKHVCPLQLQCIHRCMVLWSNPGDVVLDPFGGVGSTGYEAVRMGRKAVMCELKGSYYRQMLRNMESLKRKSASKQGMIS